MAHMCGWLGTACTWCALAAHAPLEQDAARHPTVCVDVSGVQMTPYGLTTVSPIALWHTAVLARRAKIGQGLGTSSSVAGGSCMAMGALAPCPALCSPPPAHGQPRDVGVRQPHAVAAHQHALLVPARAAAWAGALAGCAWRGGVLAAAELSHRRTKPRLKCDISRVAAHQHAHGPPLARTRTRTRRTCTARHAHAPRALHAPLVHADALALARALRLVVRRDFLCLPAIGLLSEAGRRNIDIDLALYQAYDTRHAPTWPEGR